MNVFESALSCCGVTQMSHIHFARIGEFVNFPFFICVGITHYSLICLMYSVEDFGYGICSFSPFSEHVFIARLGFELDTSQASPFLTAVMLFLHHQIEFVQPIHPCTVFLLVIFKRLQQAYHCHTAIFMYFPFH